MKKRLTAFSEWADMKAPTVFILPAIMVILMLAVFPLIISLYLSLSRFKFIKGGFSLKFIGLLNYKKLVLGSQQFHFLGVFGGMGPLGWLIIIALSLLLVWWLIRYFRSGTVSVLGTLGRIIITIGVFWRCRNHNPVCYRRSGPGREIF